MKKVSVYLISFFLIFQSSLLAYSTNPKNFVEELVNEAIGVLSDKNQTKEQKASFVEKMALENVDIKALSLYTLGGVKKIFK